MCHILSTAVPWSETPWLPTRAFAEEVSHPDTLTVLYVPFSFDSGDPFASDVGRAFAEEVSHPATLTVSCVPHSFDSGGAEAGSYLRRIDFVYH